jgi:hypothetical protein
MNKIIITFAAVMGILLSLYVFVHYQHYQDISKARKRISNVSYKSDPSMKFAYESWFRGLDAASIYNKNLIISGSSKIITFKRNSKELFISHDVYIIGSRSITEVRVDDKRIFPVVNETIDDLYYERPDGLVIQHLSTDLPCTEIEVVDSKGVVYKVSEFTIIDYTR